MSTFIEAIALLLAFIFLSHTKELIWRTVKWFLLFTVLLEITVNIIGKVYHRHNLWLVNVFTLVNFFVISWLLYRLSPQRKINRLLLSITAVVFAACFAYEIIYKGFFEYTVYSSIVSDIIILVFCNRYFYLLLKEDAWIDIPTHPAFWLVTGLFLFNLCALVADLFDEQLSSLYIFPDVSLYYLLYLVFSLILYSCWSFAFICKYQETK